MGNFAIEKNGPLTGSAAPGSLGLDLATPALYIAGTSGVLTQVGAGGGGGALTLIQKQTLGSPAATVTFSAIPQSYSNLKLVINSSSGSGSTTIRLNVNFNGDTGNNYFNSYLYNVVTTPTAQQVETTPVGILGYAGSSALLAATEAMIYAYTGALAGAKAVTAMNSSAQGITLASVQWASAAAITTIALSVETAASFATGSTFSLYGLS